MDKIGRLKELATGEFRSRFGGKPEVFVCAPGRVNLIGEHTDYNDGFVFPMAIERYTVIAARVCSGAVSRKAVIHSHTVGLTAEFSLLPDVKPAATVDWSSYVQGAISCSGEKGLVSPDFQAVIVSDVPLGGGLSSSASLEVAVATLMERLSGKTVSPIEKALLCQQAEHRFAKMPCGIMDQFISTMGKRDHAMLLDCRTLEPKMIPLIDPAIVVLIANSNVKHTLTGSEYPERRSSCAEAAALLGVGKLRDATLRDLEACRQRFQAAGKDFVYKRARHVITENERTVRMAEAVQAEDWALVGTLMYQSHESLRSDYEVSCPEVDFLVESAQKIGVAGGVIGSRITGGGFGGCTVSLVKADYLDEVINTLSESYKTQTGIAPTLFATRAASGAMVPE